MARTCKCGNTFIQYNTLQSRCVPCAIVKGKKDVAAKVKRDQAAKEKQGRADHRADRDRVKPRAEWLDKLQTLVNQYVMHVRDAGKPCCTCGKPRTQAKFDAGHFISRGSSPELRFELTNIHPQCSVNCNQHGSGMRAEYQVFIVEQYGHSHLDWLEGPHPLLKDQFPHYEDIKAEIKRYRALLRENRVRPNA